MSLTVTTINLVIDVIMHNFECSLSDLEKITLFEFARGKYKLVNVF